MTSEERQAKIDEVAPLLEAAQHLEDIYWEALGELERALGDDIPGELGTVQMWSAEALVDAVDGVDVEDEVLG